MASLARTHIPNVEARRDERCTVGGRLDATRARAPRTAKQAAAVAKQAAAQAAAKLAEVEAALAVSVVGAPDTASGLLGAFLLGVRNCSRSPHDACLTRCSGTSSKSAR